jgi:hypothetical protein
LSLRLFGEDVVGVAFDTLKFVEKLEGGGFTHAQAKAAAEAFADATGEQLATKADVRELRGDIAKLEAATKADIAKLEVATKAEIAKLAETTKAAIAEGKAETLKWMFGQTLLIVGVLMALLRFAH